MGKHNDNGGGEQNGGDKHNGNGKHNGNVKHNGIGKHNGGNDGYSEKKGAIPFGEERA